MLREWTAALVMGVVGSGCCCGPPTLSCAPLPPLPDAAFLVDAPHGHDAGPDARDAPTAPVPCGTLGGLGGVCRAGVCAPPATCRDELVSGSRDRLTWRDFGVARGGEVDAETRFSAALPDDDGLASDDVELAIAPGGLCTSICDAAATSDPCGRCATCVIEIGTTDRITTATLSGWACRSARRRAGAARTARSIPRSAVTARRATPARRARARASRHASTTTRAA